MSYTIEVMAILWCFFAYFGQNLVAVATSLRPCNQKFVLWIGRPRKLPVISNRVLVICRRNAFKYIYSNFSPNIGCHGNAPWSLVYGVSQTNSPMAQTLSQNQTLHGCVAYNWSYGHFCDFSAYFGQNLVAMATSLRPLQSEMSYLDWPITPYPRIRNFLNSCYTSEVMSIRRFATSLALRG